MKSRLLVSCILFSSLCATAQADVQNRNTTIAPVVVGDTSRIKDSDLDIFRDLADKHRADVNKQNVKSPINLNMDEKTKAAFNRYKNEAEAIHASAEQKVQQRIRNMNNGEFVGNADLSKARYTTLVFASLSMPETDIEEMYRSLAGDTETTIVFRGLPKGAKTINEAIAYYQQIARKLKLKTTPNVIINPVLFEQYQVGVVPTIIRLTEPTPNRSGDPQTMQTKVHPKMQASVEGLILPVWLNRQIKEGHQGFLGRKGAVYNIEEEDIISELQKRAANIDWEEKKRQAQARIWKNIPFEELSPTSADKKRVIDPTFELQQDIRGVKGELIAAKGTRVNPLQARTFDRMLVVFDATNRQEVAFVERHLPQWRTDHRINSEQTFMLMTGIDRDNGWTEHKKLVERFNSRMYLLQSDVKNTFGIRHHPCIVYQNGERFVVEEFKVD